MTSPANANPEHAPARGESRGRVLLVLGGIYHEFERYAQIMGPMLETWGYSVATTYSLDSLAALAQSEPAGHNPEAVDVVLMYTCIGGREPLPPQEAGALDCLVDWVAQGGRFLAAHAATVTGKHHARFAQMAGGYFIEHPPQFAFQVTPMGQAHPVTQDVPAFSVFDEFYIQSYAADVDIHLVAADRGVAYPMAWTRSHHAGWVANVALGHSERVWQLPVYQQIIGQTVDWLMAE